MKLRPYQPRDAEPLLSLFRTTIRSVNVADYAPEQIAAWSSDEIDLDDWAKRFDDRIAFVVVIDDQYAGFADLARNGYLDRLFVSAAHQRQGVATALFDALQAAAIRDGIQEITTDASITAVPFFEVIGFQIVRRQVVDCRGAQLVNYRMAWRAAIEDLRG